MLDAASIIPSNQQKVEKAPAASNTKTTQTWRVVSTSFFKRDSVDPELLHIFARHATSPEEAIETFFAAEPRWNEKRQRFETYSATHGIFWYWIEPKRVVMVVSCFKL